MNKLIYNIASVTTCLAVVLISLSVGVLLIKFAWWAIFAV